MDDAWNAARDQLSVARSRCLERIAARLGREPAALPRDIIDAVRDALHDAFQIGQQYTHEMPTIPARPAPGQYHVQPSDEVTRVARPRPKR